MCRRHQGRAGSGILAALLVLGLGAGGQAPAQESDGGASLLQRLPVPSNAPARSAGGAGAASNRLPGAVTAQDSVSFNYDQVDVRAFVKTVGELTGRKFVIAEGVQ